MGQQPLFSSCSNKELVTKLLEMRPAVDDKPTVEELEKVITDFEVRKKSEELLNPDPKSRRVDASKAKSAMLPSLQVLWP